MKKIFAAVAFAAAALAPAASSAGAIRFEVSSIECQRADCSDGRYWTTALESIGFSFKGPTAFLYSKSINFGSHDEFKTRNSHNFIGAYVEAFKTYDDGTNCTTSERCLINAQFQFDGISDYGSGSIKVESYESDLFMASGEEGLWSGWITSDYPMTWNYLNFTGYWVGWSTIEVPEPSAIALFGASLAALIGLRRRRKA